MLVICIQYLSGGLGNCQVAPAIVCNLGFITETRTLHAYQGRRGVQQN